MANEAGFVLAEVLIRDKDLCNKYLIANQDQAYDLMKNGILKGKELTKLIERAVTLPGLENPDPSLCTAVSLNLLNKGNIQFITSALNSGSNPNLKLPDGSKVIHHAHDFETTRLLVQFGAKLDKEVFKKSFLSKNQIQILQHEEKVFKKAYAKHDTRLHQECLDYIKSGDLERLSGMIHRLYSLESNFKIKINGTDQDLLSIAARANQPKIVEYLLKTNLKFDLDKALVETVKDTTSETKVYYKAHQDSLIIASLLIKNGASKKISTDDITLKSTVQEINKISESYNTLNNGLKSYIMNEFKECMNDNEGKTKFCNKMREKVKSLVDNTKCEVISNQAGRLFEALKEEEESIKQLSSIRKFGNSVREVLGIDNFSRLLENSAKAIQKEILGEHTKRFAISKAVLPEITRY